VATNLHRVLENFRWRIGQIAPTCTTARKGFTSPDATKSRTTQSSGQLRDFVVRWDSSGGDEGPSDTNGRIADHQVMVEAIYPVVLNEDQLQEMIVLDRHDIAFQLQQSANVLGYSDDAPTTDVGIMLRQRVRDNLERQAQIWRLKMTFRVKVRERQYA